MKLGEVRKRVLRARRSIQKMKGSGAASRKAVFDLQFRAVVAFHENWSKSLGQIDHVLVVMLYEEGRTINGDLGREGVLLKALMPTLDRRSATDWRNALRPVLAGQITAADVTSFGFRAIARHYKSAKGQGRDRAHSASRAAKRAKKSSILKKE